MGGPVKDEQAGVERVRAQAVNDDVKGWITVAGSQGTVYLKEGGGLFKVVKETILTDAVDVAAAAKTQKMKVGDVVEVREWPKKDEVSGLVRLKCRLRGPGGHVGWATAV